MLDYYCWRSRRSFRETTGNPKRTLRIVIIYVAVHRPFTTRVRLYVIREISGTFRTADAYKPPVCVYRAGRADNRLLCSLLFTRNRNRPLAGVIIADCSKNKSFARRTDTYTARRSRRYVRSPCLSLGERNRPKFVFPVARRRALNHYRGYVYRLFGYRGARNAKSFSRDLPVEWAIVLENRSINSS